MQVIDLEKVSDAISHALGSTISVIVHTILFFSIFLLRMIGVPIDQILLVLTTLLSIEAIYLSIFIQRSSNKQTVRIEQAVLEIRDDIKRVLGEPVPERENDQPNSTSNTRSATTA